MAISQSLPTPPEPKDVRNRIIDVSKILGPGDEIDWDSQAVWAFNALPKYLWENWGPQLKPMGFTWQRFLKLLKLHTNDMILWALREAMTWEDFVRGVIRTLERYR